MFLSAAADTLGMETKANGMQEETGMIAAANAGCFPVQGTSALKAEPAQGFEVFEGGLAQLSAIPAQRTLSPLQRFFAGAALIAAIVVLFSASLVRSYADSAARAAIVEGADYAEVVVISGQGLWDIAEAHPVEGLSTAELVDHIIEVNGLPNATIHSGQRLSVPVIG